MIFDCNYCEAKYIVKFEIGSGRNFLQYRFVLCPITSINLHNLVKFNNLPSSLNSSLGIKLSKYFHFAVNYKSLGYVSVFDRKIHLLLLGIKGFSRSTISLRVKNYQIDGLF